MENKQNIEIQLFQSQIYSENLLSSAKNLLDQNQKFDQQFNQKKFFQRKESSAVKNELNKSDIQQDYSSSLLNNNQDQENKKIKLQMSPLTNSNNLDQQNKKLNILQFKKGCMLKTTKVAHKNEEQIVSKNNFNYNSQLKIVKNFLILFYVKRFIRTVQHFGSWFKIHNLQRKQFQIINDQSAYYEYYQFKNYFHKDIPGFFQQLLRKIIQYWHYFQIQLGYDQRDNENQSIQIVPLLPTSTLKIFFDCILMFVLIYMTIFIPVQIGFEFQDGDFKFNRYFCIAWLLIDIFLIKTNSAIYSDGHIIVDRLSVICQYIKGNFLIDIFTTFSLILSNILKLPIISLIFLARFQDLQQIYDNLQVTLQFRGKYAALSRLIQLMGYMFLTAHFMACGWHRIALYEIQNTDPSDDNIWLASSLDQEWYVRYVKSIYWAIITMTTIGYGDVSAVTFNIPSRCPDIYLLILLEEQIFCTFAATISTVQFYMFCERINDAYKDLGKMERILQQKIVNLSYYMNKRHLSNELKMKVIKYFQYLNNEHCDADEEGNQLVHIQLAPSLRNEVLKEINGKIIRSKRFFRLFFSDKLLDELALKMKETIIGPEEIIYKEGEQADKIYFIVKGSVQIFLNIQQYNSSDIPISTISEGDTLGEYEFFNNIQREMAARSVGVTSLAYIELEDFNDMVKHFPSDYEQIKVIQHLFMNCGIKTCLDLECLSCGSYKHSLVNCSLINMTPNKEYLIHKFQVIENSMQDRNIMIKSRKIGKSANAIINNQISINKADNLIHDIKIKEEKERKHDQLKYMQYDCESSHSNSNNSQVSIQSEEENQKKKKIFRKQSIQPKIQFYQFSNPSEEEINQFDQQQASQQPYIDQNKIRSQKSSYAQKGIQIVEKNSSQPQQGQYKDEVQILNNNEVARKSRKLIMPNYKNIKSIMPNYQKDESLTHKKNQLDELPTTQQIKKQSFIHIQRDSDQSLSSTRNFEFQIKKIHFDILNYFETLKLYNYFLQHNNYDVVLNDIEKKRVNGATFKELIKNQKKKLKKQLFINSESKVKKNIKNFVSNIIRKTSN